MKFTKRAYVKVWQNCPEDECEDTTITPPRLRGRERTQQYPGSPPIPAGTLCVRQQYERIQHPRTLSHSRIVRPHRLRQNLPGHAQQNRRLLDPMKFITASPKPVDGIPPVSYCPRCRALIWPDTTKRCINGQPENDTEYYRRILEIYKNNPDPLFCHNCGQRFKYVGQDHLVYNQQSNRADILRTLKLKAETQPTFDLAELNQ